MCHISPGTQTPEPVGAAAPLALLVPCRTRPPCAPPQTQAWGEQGCPLSHTPALWIYLTFLRLPVVTDKLEMCFWLAAPSRNGLGGTAALFLSSMGGILWAARGFSSGSWPEEASSPGQMQESPKSLQAAWLPSSPSQGQSISPLPLSYLQGFARNVNPASPPAPPWQTKPQRSQQLRVVGIFTERQMFPSLGKAHLQHLTMQRGSLLPLHTHSPSTAVG